LREIAVISRNWRGIAKPQDAENYINHLKNETFPQLSRIGGFIGASILRRPTAKGEEFLIVTTWRSMEAIQQFAGKSAHIAVVPPAVQAMMVEYDKEVTHYEIADTYLPE
jgi:heme-degrading monooxygenase HmoA